MAPHRRYVALLGLAAIGLLAVRSPLASPKKRIARVRRNERAWAAPKEECSNSGPPPIDVGNAEWPQFLGPDRTNVSQETGLLAKWPSDGPRLIGTLEGLGTGFSNVAIRKGVVYTMGSRGAREYVMAISLRTGGPVWDYDNAAAYRNGNGDGPRSTPTLDEDRLYALGPGGQLVCLEIASGREIWKKDLVREFGTRIRGWGACESVLVDGTQVICTPGGSRGLMAALDKASGEVLWRSPAAGAKDGTAYASPIAVEVGGVRQYVNYAPTEVIGVRASDGKVLWRDSSSANGTANCCAPLFADGTVLTSSGYGKGSSLLSLSSSGGVTSAELVYHTSDLQVQHGGLVAIDGHLYGSSHAGVLTCVELKTGKTKWRHRCVGKASLTSADGRLVVRGEEGPVALVAADPGGYEELGRFTPQDQTASPAWTYPVVCGGKLFLRDQDLLQVYELQEFPEGAIELSYGRPSEAGEPPMRH